MLKDDVGEFVARTITTTDTTMKTPVYTVGLMNNTVRAMTVAMSVTKHDAGHEQLADVRS